MEGWVKNQNRPVLIKDIKGSIFSKSNLPIIPPFHYSGKIRSVLGMAK
jgi:hypothetical protein